MTSTDTHAIENRQSESTDTQHQARTGREQATRPVYRPRVDIHESGDEFIAHLDIPGARADSIDVEFERGTLTISAAVDDRTHPESHRWLLREYGVGNYERSFTLTDEVAADRIAAEFKNGVLSLTLPKTDHVKPRKVPVTSD
ncbi:MAG: Hsp20/alpha crystallin family protein [Planctomycetes bacterium]|nr:Hsp20/alpha crystallin family protein [Planctomycetota bacterium]NOG54164.1 Hsp20/alpha crystallin family protein [Planctomycetota bacterium]